MTSQALRSRDVTTEPENMEAKKEYQRFYFLQGYSSVRAYNRFILVTCTRWAREFANGREAVEDEHRSGAPKPVRSENTVESVRKQIDQDPHSSIRQIS